MLRQELSLGYFDFIHRPGEKLGVLDNASDFESCRERTHCNATHDTIAPKVVWDEAQCRYTLDDSGLQKAREAFHARFTGMRHSLLGGGEHNNVYFPGFYHYKRNIPQALMQTIDGQYLELKDPDILGGKPIPMPAIDDSTLLDLYARQQAVQAEGMAGCHYVIGYVMGAEMLYPEYFGLGSGDYRPESWQHFLSFCKILGETPPSKEDTLKEGSDGRALWLRFREQAMADRASFYYQAILSRDNTHLCYYPTHGSALHGQSRCALGQQPETLLGSCDGIEMGHILIDHDPERRNVIMTGLNASYGAPVIVPRLGNKTPDLSAAGGGRSFTQATLRRFVYECVGMGVPVIYPIHWRSCLHDGEWFIKDTPAEAECRKVFDELTLAAPFTAGMGRLQPQIGILAANDTWLKSWQPEWTGLMQDALCDRAAMTVITDAILEEGLSRKMPFVLSVSNSAVGHHTLQQLLAYLNEGGKLLVWGSFAENAADAMRKAILNHSNCCVSRAARANSQRVLREMFLGGARLGTYGKRYCFMPLDYELICDEIKQFAPKVLLYPFTIDGHAGEVNIFTLTDRASVMAVCVNNGPEVAEFSLRPDPRMMDGDIGAWDALTGLPLDMPLIIPGLGTAMVFFAHRPTEEYDEALCRAEDSFESWDSQKAAVGALRHNYAGIRSGLYPQKRFALAKCLLSSLAIKAEVDTLVDGSLSIQARVLDANGQSPADAILRVRTVPGEYKHIPLQADGQGSYSLNIKKENLPLSYDPQAMRYLPVKGNIRLILEAEQGDRQGGCILNYIL